MGYAPMPIKSYYDRNPSIVTKFHQASIPAGAGKTTRWSLTIPSNKTVYMSIIYMHCSDWIITAGSYANNYFDITPSGGSLGTVAFGRHNKVYGVGQNGSTTQTLTAICYLLEGDKIEYKNRNTDTVAKTMAGSVNMLEFDT